MTRGLDRLRQPDKPRSRLLRRPFPCRGNKPLGDALERIPLWRLRTNKGSLQEKDCNVRLALSSTSAAGMMIYSVLKTVIFEQLSLEIRPPEGENSFKPSQKSFSESRLKNMSFENAYGYRKPIFRGREPR